ncbi:MAG: ABC transporter permease [Verrucomicrobiota bacterium]|nr:ABC transporter permease [Verrucomicrobiota bacterium]
MNLGSIIESGVKEIWAHWFRSLLTMFGIILGVASLVTMSAFVKGKENLLRDSLAESGGLERIIVDDNDDLPDYQKHLQDEANGVTLKDVYALQKNAPLVYNVTPVIEKRSFRGSLQISRKNKRARYATVKGTWPSLMDIEEHELKHGRSFSDMDDHLANTVCIIGTQIRNELFGEFDNQGNEIIPIGEKIMINYIPFKIIGMFKEYMSEEDRIKKEEAMAAGQTAEKRDFRTAFRSGDRNSGRAMIVYLRKNSTIMVPLNTLVSKLDSSYDRGSNMDRSLSKVAMKIYDVSTLEKSLQQVRNVLMQTHKGLEDFEFETQEGFAGDIALSIQNERISGMFIAGICLLVGGIGIINIMLSSISERVREIGIRKSIGATNMDVFLQIVTESIVIAMAGGIVGLIVSPILVNTLAGFADDTTPPVMTAFAMAIAFGFSVITGSIAGLFPAIKAAKLDPIQALRYD